MKKCAILLIVIGLNLVIGVQVLFGFNYNGIIIDDIGSNGDDCRAVAIQPDGKILAVGNIDTLINSYQKFRFAVVRYIANGARDNSFGIGGTVKTHFGGDWDIANAVTIQSDGKIIVAGVSAVSGGRANIAIARYATDGSLDTEFGEGGKVLTAVENRSVDAQSIALQSDGKIVVAGYSDMDIVLARYHIDGSLDLAFGINGVVIHDISNYEQETYSVAIDSNGKIVVAGCKSSKHFGT